MTLTEFLGAVALTDRVWRLTSDGEVRSKEGCPLTVVAELLGHGSFMIAHGKEASEALDLTSQDRWTVQLAADNLFNWDAAQADFRMKLLAVCGLLRKAPPPCRATPEGDLTPGAESSRRVEDALGA